MTNLKFGNFFSTELQSETNQALLPNQWYLQQREEKLILTDVCVHSVQFTDKLDSINSVIPHWKLVTVSINVAALEPILKYI